MQNTNDDYVIQALAGTVSNAALTLATFASAGFSASNIAKAHSVLITVNTNNVNWTGDGTLVPTVAGVGHLIAAGGTYEIAGVAIVRALKFIRQGSSDATVTISLIGNAPQKGAVNYGS